MRDSQLYFLIGWLFLIADNLDNVIILSAVGGVVFFIIAFFGAIGDRYDD